MQTLENLLVGSTGLREALRFFPDASVGYEYPELYIKFFGHDYKLEPYRRRVRARAESQVQVVHDVAVDHDE
jgi:hypothetical protein